MRFEAVRRVLSRPSIACLTGLSVSLGCVAAGHAATITWDGGGGNLNWLTPANWSGDALPGLGDDVVIDAAGAVTISLAGSASVNSLTCADALTVSGGGTLTVAASANVSGLVSLTNGKLSGGTWTLPAGLLPTDSSINTLTALTLNGNASIGTNNRLYLVGGLVLNGTLTLNGANPRLVVNGTQTIGGNATIQLDSPNINASRIHVEGTSVLTLAPTVLIDGGFGEIGTHISTAGVSSIINQGTIRCDVPGASFSLVGEQFINEGTVEAVAGTLTVAASQAWANDGLIRSVGGTVVLAGVVNPIDLGDVRNVTGAVVLQAALPLAGGTLALDAVTGIWTLDGTTLSNGTLNVATGSSPIFTGANTTFDAIEVDGNLAIGTNQRLVIKNGLELNGTMTLNGSNPRLIANGTQTISGGATIQLDSPNLNASRIHIEGTSILTIAPSVLIEGGFAEIGAHVNSAGVSGFVNQGTIRCDTTNATFDIVGEQFTNEGTIEVTAGTLRILAGSWTNTSTMTSLGGTLRLGGSTTLASLDGVSNGGGAVQYATALDLTGETFTLSPADGIFTFDGSTLTNGTLVVEAGATPIFTSNPTTFDALTVSGNLTIGTNQQLWIKNGLTLNGTLTMNGSNPRLVVNGTQTIGGNATIQLDSPNQNASRIHVEGTSILTIAPSVLIDGGWGDIGTHLSSAGVSGVINQGTIRCDTAGATLTLAGEQFTNTNLIEVTAGTLAVSPTQSWANGGLMRALTGGTLRLVGPTTLAGIGDVRNVSGAVNVENAIALGGATLSLNATTGVWTFTGATVSNGTLAVAAGATPIFTSLPTTFDALTVNGNLLIDTTDQLWIKNGLTLNGTLTMTGANPRLIVNGTQTIGGSATILMNSPNLNASRVNIEGTSVLTIAPSVLIEGGFAEIGVSVSTDGVSGVINQGTIRCNAGGANFSIAGEQFTNANLVEVTAGTLAVAPTQSWTNSGSMRAAGGTLRLVGPTTVSDLGDVRNVSGTVSVENTIALGGSTFNLNATTGVWTFSGATLSNGTLAVAAGATPIFTSTPTTFDALTVNGTLAVGTNQQLWIKNGLTLNGTMTMNGANPRLVVNGTQTIGGNATIQLDSPNANASRLHVEGTSTLTIAPTVTLEGMFGEIGTHISTAGVSSVVNQGTIRADTAGAILTIVTSNGDLFTNSGTVEATNASLLIVESATNLAGNTLTGGTWKSNNATIRFGAAAAGTPIRTLAAECVLTGRNGKILDLAKLEAIAINGVLRLNDGAVLTAVPATGTLVDNGFLFVNGTSKLNVTGGFTHSPTAILTVATGAANQVFVDASAALSLDGFLQVSNGPGYTPIAGDQVVIADGNSRTGTFDSVTTCELADLFYTPTQAIYVYGEDTGVFADLNGDGIVGAPDLALLLGSWGPCSDLCCNADLDQSGAVGAPDIALLLGSWG